MEIFHLDFLTIRWLDLLDITIVAFILYKIYDLLKGGIAINIFFGVLFIYILWFLCTKWLKLTLLGALLGQFMGVGVLALIIVFQPELRKFLVLLGTNSLTIRNIFKKQFTMKDDGSTQVNFTPIVKACKNMSASKTGALIVIAGNNDLTYYANSGDVIDAVVSKRLIESIFTKTSPMHDGALIIQNNRVKAARCILPITQEDDLPAHFGTRHRAAVGISEQCDGVAIVVSEETGEISIAHDGELIQKIVIGDLEKLLTKLLVDDK